MNTGKFANLTAILALTALMAGSCGLWREETKMTMTELPATVRTAMQKVTAGSTVTQIEKIESGGKVTYEVEYRKDGKDHETYFAEDGTIVKGAQ
jgi:Protein of unknown function (DUF2874).